MEQQVIELTAEVKRLKNQNASLRNELDGAYCQLNRLGVAMQEGYTINQAGFLVGSLAEPEV